MKKPLLRRRGSRYCLLFLLPVASIIFCLLLIEGLLAAGYMLSRRQNPYAAALFKEYRSRMENLAATVHSESAHLPSIVPHPYAGYVANFDARKSHKGMPVNRYGFFSEVEALYRPVPDEEFVVVVLGGSLAAQFCIVGADALREGLENLPITRGKRVVINSLAQGGYKQPQQLIVFSYFLSLGLQADLLINIDGVNEMVFFQQNALENRIDPSFPWNWLALTAQNNLDQEIMSARLTIIRERENREKFAAALLRSGLYPSTLVRYIRRRFDLASISKEESAEEALADRLRLLSRQEAFYFKTGPVYWSGDDLDEALLESARLWKRASIALSDLARERGIPYVHGLQPNQYFFPESPPPERKPSRIYNPESHFFEALTRGYSFFISQEEILRANKVPFVDYNQSFFGHVPEAFYEDDFAHLNRRGNEILAGAVVESVARLTSPASASGKEE